MDVAVHVSRLFVYPVKSCAPVEVSSARLDVRGFVHDRRFMVVDGSDRFLSMREEVGLGRVRAEIAGDRLRLEAPGVGATQIDTRFQGATRTVRIWDDECEAMEEPRASEWYSEALGRRVRFVRMADGFARRVSEEHAGPGHEVGFADAFPLLIISEASLAALNARLLTPVPMERFRPNIVVAGCAPFSEDGFARFAVADIPMRAVKSCSRCVITTTDPATGQRAAEPMRTLASFRTVGGKVMFGQNVVHEALGTIRRSDAVRVLT
jgi:uncharacterized protein YcbX